MFASSGSLLDANQAFSKLPQPDVYDWSAIISANAKLGQEKQAIQLFYDLQCTGVKPDGYVFSAVLKACAGLGDIHEGKEVHTQIIQSGLKDNLFVANTLIEMYMRCNSNSEAQAVFDELAERDIVTWNLMFAGMEQNGSDVNFLECFKQMEQEGLQPNPVTYVNVLKACASTEEVRNIHMHSFERGFEGNIHINNTMIDMYLRCGSLMDAQRVFKRVVHLDVVTCNTMIVGYGQFEYHEDACQLFHEMQLVGVEPDLITFSCVFPSCAKMARVADGRQMHALAVQRGFDIDVLVGYSLIEMYADYGCLEDACRLFNKLPQHDTVTWNAMIRGLAQHELWETVSNLLRKMQQVGPTPNPATFLSVLKACSHQEGFEQGPLHVSVVACGVEMDVTVGSTLVDMYIKCEKLEHAKILFERLPKHSTVVWSKMLESYVQHGFEEEAFLLFIRMQHEGVEADLVAVISCLKGLAAVEHGMLIHLYVVCSGVETDALIVSALIDMYAKSGNLDEIHYLFKNSSKQSVFVWNSMIASCLHNRNGCLGIKYFYEMVEEDIKPNRTTYLSILKTCSSMDDPTEGKLLHSHILEAKLETDVFVGNNLLDMYTKFGSLLDARLVFDQLLCRDVVSWNTMISGFNQFGQTLEALIFFEKMQQEGARPDKLTYLSILRGCSGLADSMQGRLAHYLVISSKFEACVSVGSAVIVMYMECGSFTDAVSVFHKMSKQEDISWNGLIVGFFQHGKCENALELIQRMHAKGMQLDEATLVSILRTCSNSTLLDVGRVVHGHILSYGQEQHLYVANNLINMYVKCGSLPEAQMLFARLPKQDTVSWSTMIAGHVQYGQAHVALEMFWKMQQVGLNSDQVTYVSTLKACASICALDQGKLIHAHIVENGSDSDLFVCNTLILMYSKSGTLIDACSVLTGMPKRDLVTWNTMIGGYASSGDFASAKQTFKDMQQEGWIPNPITFLHLLSACSHVGLVEEGLWYLRLMRQDFCVQPTVEHYDCMVALLGRMGHLSSAEDCLESLPFGCNIVGWTSLLSNCKDYLDVQRAMRCFDNVIVMDHRSAAGYAIMSSIFVYLGMLEEAQVVEDMRQCSNAWKKPGEACIEVNNVAHNFTVGGRNHPQSVAIYAKLETLDLQLRKEGYKFHFADHAN